MVSARRRTAAEFYILPCIFMAQITSRDKTQFRIACILPFHPILTGSAAAKRVDSSSVLVSEGLLTPGLRSSCPSDARSGHDFLQVHIPPEWARVAGPSRSAVAVLKVATSSHWHRHVTRRLPDVLVSDRDTRFTSAFWTGLYAALGESLIFGSPLHHNTTFKVAV